MNPRTRLLIIDDDANITSSIKRNLELNHAFDVLVAASGREGLALARDKSPDVILLDVMMPGMGGGEVAEALHEHARTSAIPIVFFTGLLNKAEAKAKAESRGPRYLSKPASIQEIVTTLREAIVQGKCAAAKAPAGRVYDVDED